MKQHSLYADRHDAHTPSHMQCVRDFASTTASATKHSAVAPQWKKGYDDDHEALQMAMKMSANESARYFKEMSMWI